MRLQAAASFDRCLKTLDAEGKRRVFAVIEQVNAHYGSPHKHIGAGIRRIGKVLECRDSLGKRLLFVREGDTLVFLFYGDHDEVRLFAKNHRE